MDAQERFEAVLVIVEYQMNQAVSYSTPGAYASASLVELVRVLANVCFFDGPLTADHRQRIDAILENYQRIVTGSYR